MSVPAMVSATITSMNPMDVIMGSVNSNPYFIGIMMLLLNLGGRYLSLEITKEQEKFLSQPAVRRFFLFAVIFVATRNIVIAAGLAIIVIVILGYLFNENSEFCLWHSCLELPKSKEAFTGLTQEETTILKNLQKKMQAQVPQEYHEVEQGEKEKEEIQVSDIYSEGIHNLKQHLAE